MGRLPPVFGAAFVVAALMMLPLRIALGWANAADAGLSAAAVEGTVWGGTLRDAQFRGLVLGDARVALAPLAGGLHVVAAGELRGEGVVAHHAGGGSIRDLDADLPLARIAPSLPLSGAVALRGLRADFAGGVCRHAAGEVRLTGLELAGVRLPGLQLGGQAACRDRALVVPLVGQAGGAAVDAMLRIDGAGRYQLDTRLRATDPAVQAGAAMAGFERGLDGFMRTDRGRLAGGYPPRGP